MMRLIVLVCALVAITAGSPLHGRIVGGENATLGQFPWQISLRAEGRHHCGGTILNDRWILTAAHCLESRSIEVLTVAVGTVKLDDPQARVYEIAEGIMHADYDPWIIINDIGLIRLTESIEFNDNVQPCELNTEDIGAGEELTLSGWGRLAYPGERPEVLQWITLRSLTMEQCEKEHFNPVVDSQLCTFTQKGEGACHGDSGGPLVWNGRISGVVSWGIPCALGYPDVFTRVSSFIDWIQERIEN